MDDNKHHRRDDNRAPGPLIWASTSEAAPMTDVMIDIETLGTKPGSAILSIGAVMFGPAGLGEEFYAPISLASCTEAGLTIDPKTVAWWMQQSDDARAAAFRDDALPLSVALLRFAAWFDSVSVERPWCHGANFDPPLLDAAFDACDMTPPWKFWNVRDTRTLYDLAGVKVDRRKGTHHNALDDARVQAETAVVALQRLQAADASGLDTPLYSTRQDADRWRTMVRLTLADTMVDLVEAEIAKRPSRDGMTTEQLQQEMVDCLIAAVDAERHRVAAVGIRGQHD